MNEAKRHKEGFVAEYQRRPTPWRAVEVERIARESERRIRAAEAVAKTPTAPPPPFHPASIGPGALDGGAGDFGEALPRAVRRRLAECSARFEIVLSHLRAGGLSRQEAATVVRVELQSLEAATKGAQLPSASAMLAAMRLLSEELSGVAGQIPCDPLQIVIIGEEVDARERLAVAIETLGHSVRSFNNLRELSERAILPSPEAFFVCASLRGEAPDTGFADILREMAHARKAHVIMFTTSVAAPVANVAKDSGAHGCVRVSPNGSVGPLAAQVMPLLEEVIW
jgi:hypothetical protein